MQNLKLCGLFLNDLNQMSPPRLDVFFKDSKQQNMHKQMEFLEDKKVQLIKSDCAYGIVSGEGNREYVVL